MSSAGIPTNIVHTTHIAPTSDVESNRNTETDPATGQPSSQEIVNHPAGPRQAMVPSANWPFAGGQPDIAAAGPTHRGTPGFGSPQWLMAREHGEHVKIDFVDALVLANGDLESVKHLNPNLWTEYEKLSSAEQAQVPPPPFPKRETVGGDHAFGPVLGAVVPLVSSLGKVFPIVRANPEFFCDKLYQDIALFACRPPELPISEKLNKNHEWSRRLVLTPAVSAERYRLVEKLVRDLVTFSMKCPRVPDGFGGFVELSDREKSIIGTIKTLLDGSANPEAFAANLREILIRL